MENSQIVWDQSFRKRRIDVQFREAADDVGRVTQVPLYGRFKKKRNFELYVTYYRQGYYRGNSKVIKTKPHLYSGGFQGC